jgi:hypothetical protein
MNCATCKPIIEKQLKGEQSIKWIDLDSIIPHTGSFATLLLQSFHLTDTGGQELTIVEGMDKSRG